MQLKQNQLNNRSDFFVGMFSCLGASTEKIDGIILSGLEFCQVSRTEGTESICKTDKQVNNQQGSGARKG